MTREEAASCINTIVILKNLCYRVRGLMDVIDAQNCDKIIEMLNNVGETHKKHTETHACDTISRQGALDGLSKLRPRMIDTYEKDGDPFLKVRACDVNDMLEGLPPAQPELIRCKYCKHSEHWYRDKSRCFLWHEEGIDVFEDGYCNYAERRTDVDMRGEQDG